MEALQHPLHHAYVIEGGEAEFLVLEAFLKEAGIISSENPLFIERYTQFSIDDARAFKQSAYEAYEKRAMVILAGSLGSESIQALLKLFEEPIKGVYIFLIIPDVGSLAPTLLSRVFVIKKEKTEENSEALLFLQMTVGQRTVWVKEKLDSFDEGKDARVFTRSFLSEITHSARMRNFDSSLIETLLQYTIFANDRGSSPKMLLEYISLALPVIK
ncbi:MAG: hypothetical protein WCO58_00530 [bacterium]